MTATRAWLEPGVIFRNIAVPNSELQARFGASASLIAHHSAGTGAPLVQLNGNLMTMMAWEPIAAPLATKYRVIRYDVRGQFRSPGEPPPHADSEPCYGTAALIVL